MKIVRKIAGFFCLMETFVSLCIFFNLIDFENAFPENQRWVILMVGAVYGVMAFLLLRKKKSKANLQHKETISNKQPEPRMPHQEEISPSATHDTVEIPQQTAAEKSYIESGNVISRTDNKEITDEEIPYLMQVGLESALEKEHTPNNIKFNRTEREENLSVQFMMNHDLEIQEHTDNFEHCYDMACAEDDLDKKIELLQETIKQYEKSKKWFYRTKGGTIYFQDYYEHQHNSNSQDFSYISSVEDDLKYYIKKRDFIIPQILQIISSSNGILQKDVYQHMPDISKSDIQKIIKELEKESKITREKKGSSYLLCVKDQGDAK